MKYEPLVIFMTEQQQRRILKKLGLKALPVQFPIGGPEYDTLGFRSATSKKELCTKKNHVPDLKNKFALPPEFEVKNKRLNIIMGSRYMLLLSSEL